MAATEWKSKNVNTELLNFAFLRMGKRCNANESISFTKAVCNVSAIKEHDLVTVINFNTLFKRGLQVFEDLQRGNTTNMRQLDKNAVALLTNFVEEIDFHRRSLMKVLRKGESNKSNANTENEVTVTLTEHLLGRLAPGQSYVINSRTKKKGKCCCDEDHESDPVYGSTGIGHEEVWHGFVDILFTSHEAICPESLIATTLNPREEDSECATPVKKFRDNEDTEEGNDSFDGRTKQYCVQADDQAVAETIVFSLIQRARHPNCENHLVPNIMIDSERFRILMYDADKDILLCGMDLPIFYEDRLNFTSVVILWMVLHYRIFCSGINGTPEELENVKCNFQEVTEEKWEIYRQSLKVGVANFPNVKKETGTFPSFESILFGKRKW